MTHLTEKQFDIYRFLMRFHTENGYSPTLEEIGEKFNISKVTAYEHVRHLEDKGFIMKSKNAVRGIIPIIKKGTPITCPECGHAFTLA